MGRRLGYRAKDAKRSSRLWGTGGPSDGYIIDVARLERWVGARAVRGRLSRHPASTRHRGKTGVVTLVCAVELDLQALRFKRPDLVLTSTAPQHLGIA